MNGDQSQNDKLARLRVFEAALDDFPQGNDEDGIYAKWYDGLLAMLHTLDVAFPSAERSNASIIASGDPIFQTVNALAEAASSSPKGRNELADELERIQPFAGLFYRISLSETHLRETIRALRASPSSERTRYQLLVTTDAAAKFDYPLMNGIGMVASKDGAWVRADDAGATVSHARSNDRDAARYRWLSWNARNYQRIAGKITTRWHVDFDGSQPNLDAAIDEAMGTPIAASATRRSE